ncbi:tryptophan--tRNA ligase [Candidatus Saccharibacteria bacterium]|nr:tryptophan--tRNA ligase [Candidatus Saccharibacteria bacterium]
MTKPVILTGLRANNDLHIGNYFGALLPIIDMAKSHADEYEINLFVPDLHSFTTPIDHSQLQGQIMRNLKLFVAAGLPLDNENIHIYRQSFIPAHSELTWILDCFAYFGELNRMIQFKEKSGIDREKQAKEALARATNDLGQERMDELLQSTVQSKGNDKELLKIILKYIQGLTAEDARGSSVGLFNYPVLMAADILLYGAKYVPVGEDQTQHLEFARDIAERMNNKFGELFVVPEPVKKQHEFFGKDQGLRIKDLQDPSRKMSKSEASDKGIIFLGDNPDEAAKKVMSAATDSVGAVHFDVENQPGISNLLQIHALLAGKPLEEVLQHHEGQTNYGEFKGKVADQVKAFLSDFQTKLESVDEAALMAKLQSSEAQMRDKANATLLEVQKAVGLR